MNESEIEINEKYEKKKREKMIAAGRMGYAVPEDKMRKIKYLRRRANKLCPCGSGRKTKRCHGRLV